MFSPQPHLTVTTRPLTSIRYRLVIAGSNHFQAEHMKAVTFVALPPNSQALMLFYNDTTSKLETWTIQLLELNGKARFTKIPDRSFLPEIWGFTICATEDGKRVFLFGGWNEEVFCEAVWVFEWERKEWREIMVTGVGPCPRAHAAGKIAGGKLFIHGGDTDHGLTHDLWCLDLEGFQWSVIPVGNTQIACSRHAMHIQGDKLYIYGGEHGISEFETWGWHSELTDLWCLSLDQVSEGWQRIHSTPRLSTIFTSPYGVCGWNEMAFNLVAWGGRDHKSSAKLYARHPEGDWSEIDIISKTNEPIILDPDRGQASLFFYPSFAPTSPTSPRTPPSLLLFGISKKNPIIYRFEPTPTLKTKPIFWANENWRSYYGNFFFSDVTIGFPEVTFMAQKTVLTRFSQHFKSMFESSFKEGITNHIDLNSGIPSEIPSEIFRLFLKFCHGMLDLSYVDPRACLNLLLLADLWDVEELSAAIRTAASTMTPEVYGALVKAAVESAEGYQTIFLNYCAAPLLREPVLIEHLGPYYTEKILRNIFTQNAKQKYPSEGSEQLFLYAAAVFPGSEALIGFVNETFKTRFSDASGQHRIIFQNYEIAEKYILGMVEKIYQDPKNSPCERFWLKLVRNLSSDGIYRRHLGALSDALLRSALRSVGPMVPTKQPTLPPAWSHRAVLLRKYLQAVDIKDTVDMTILVGWLSPEIQLDQFLENPNFLSDFVQKWQSSDDWLGYFEANKTPGLVNYFFVRYIQVNHRAYSKMGTSDLQTLYRNVIENEYERIAVDYTKVDVPHLVEELRGMMRFYSC